MRMQTKMTKIVAMTMMMIKVRLQKIDWTMKANAILKEIESENITEIIRLIKACAMFVGKKVGLKPNQRRGNSVKEP